MIRSSSLLFAITIGSAVAAPTVQFNRDVRPILADKCFHCHGPDPGSRKASLRLDTEAGFFAPRKLKDGSDGSPTIVKGNLDKSPLYQRLITTDEDDIMPPRKEHKDMKPNEVALIKTWIEQGAPWQPHWAFIAPDKGALPAVKNESWVKTPIDRFVGARLEDKGLSPAPEADASTLVRRVALDVTGLPPTPEIVKKYAAGPKLSDEQLSALIDELMKSERYGEHRARYWLDAARYGDTHGLHFDNYREMWPYRDWVIRSFNANQPFDKFTVEQLAGDLLPNPSDDQLIATGFQRCNITTNEGGTIDEENLANYAVDRVTTMGWVYMGLTTNCGQCHDHKFDPWTMKDFYSMAAFFRNTTQSPKDGNIKDGRSAILVIPSMEDKPRWKALPGEIAAATKVREDRKQAARAGFQQWLKSATPDSINDGPEEGLIVHAPLNEGVGNEVDNACKGPDKFKATGEISWVPGGKLGPAPIMKAGATFDLGNLGDFEKNQKFSYGAWIKPARNGQFGGIIAKMDEKGGYRGWDLWIQDRSLAVHIVDKWPDNAMKVETPKPVLKIGQWQHVFVTYDGSGKPGGIRMYIDGMEQKKLKATANKLAANASIKTTTPLRIGQRSHSQIFDGGGVQDARVYTRAISQEEVKQIADIGPLRAILAAASGKRTAQQQAALYNHYLNTEDAEYQKIDKVVDKLEGERDAIKARSPITHIQEEVKGAKPMANILMRGAYDKPGEKVEAAVPAWLNAMPKDAPQNRLGLAKWVVDPANPLTARVIVNRFWQELFGQGIVKSAEDFGIMGAAPSNQALLDWLAVEFRESGWNVQHMFKLMLTSATYRQAAITTPEKIEKDRDNALLSRGPRFRMDGEMVRDYALAASGTLSPKMYGPGTKPYQPENIWDVVGLPGADTRNYVQDKGENLYRRTVYNFWKRMSPSPNMEIFNAPSRESSCVRRERTNTPIQALVTLNDPQFVEAARNLAQKAIACGCNDDAKAFAFVAERVLCRPLRDKEKPILQASLKDLRDFYKAHAGDAKQLLAVGESSVDAKLPAAELAAWTMLCNQVMNLDEVLNK
ncbi:MAG: DUF1553 domain-containing protein [Verrucomicrobiaceae bacterium]|nr:DUF1553 domain-containing protein [Verrucomicrobiaceae bacterium]